MTTVVATRLHWPDAAEAAYQNTAAALEALQYRDERFARLTIASDRPVVVKPNLCQPPDPGLPFGPRPDEARGYVTRAVTNPFCLRAIVEHLVLRGAREIWIVESVSWPGGTEHAYRSAGYEAVLGDLRHLRFLDFRTDREDERMRVRLGEGGRNERFNDFAVNRRLIEAQLLVNVGVPKCHVVLGFSGCVANLFGLLEPSTARVDAHEGADPLWDRPTRGTLARGYQRLSEAVVQVHYGIRRHLDLPELCVLDGTVCAEGDGPLFGYSRSRREDVVFAAWDDPVAVDLAAATYAGLDAESLRDQAHAALDLLTATPTYARSPASGVQVRYLDVPGDQEVGGHRVLQGYEGLYSLAYARELGLGEEPDLVVDGQRLPVSRFRAAPRFAPPLVVREAAATSLPSTVPDPDALVQAGPPDRPSPPRRAGITYFSRQP